MSDGSKQKEPFDPVARIEILQRVASNKKRSRAELAVMIGLVKYANGKTGKCWPSYNRLATDGGMTRLTAIRAVQGLKEAGCIMVEHRGERQPPLYSLIHVPPSIAHDTSTDDTIVSPTIPPNIAGDTSLVSPTIPEPVIEPGNNLVQWMDADDPQRVPDGPLAACVNHNGGCDLFPDFWKAFPVKSTVMDAEQIISSLVATGVDLQEIVAGALRYRRYSEATSGKRRQSAKQWLDRQGWRDDWTLPENKASKQKDYLGDLRKRFKAAVENKDSRALGLMLDEIHREFLAPHVWPNGAPEDGYIEEAGKLAACKACWDRVYAGRINARACSEMKPFILLDDEVYAAIESLNDQMEAADA